MALEGDYISRALAEERAKRAGARAEPQPEPQPQPTPQAQPAQQQGDYISRALLEERAKRSGGGIAPQPAALPGPTEGYWEGVASEAGEFGRKAGGEIADSPLGFAWDVTKSVPGGAWNLAVSVPQAGAAIANMLGASDRGTLDFIKALEGAKYEADTAGEQIGAGLGSLIPIGLSFKAGQLIARGASTALRRRAALAGGSSPAVLSGSGEQAAGASEEDQLPSASSVLGGAVLGAGEILPFTKMIGLGQRSGLAGFGVGITAEALQESVAQSGHNLLASMDYDPARKLHEGVGKAAIIGGVAGGAVHAGGRGVAKLSEIAAGGVPPTQEPTPDAPPVEDVPRDIPPVPGPEPEPAPITDPLDETAPEPVSEPTGEGSLLADMWGLEEAQAEPTLDPNDAGKRSTAEYNAQVPPEEQISTEDFERDLRKREVGRDERIRRDAEREVDWEEATSGIDLLPSARRPADGSPAAGYIPKVAKSAGRGDEGIEYVVVELDDLINSDNKDRSFPELQPRDTEGKPYKERVRGWMSDFRPDTLLTAGTTMTDGAPIVGRDGHAVNNGRVTLFREVYGEGVISFEDSAPQREQYQDAVKREGFDIEGMNKPVMVRMLSEKKSLEGMQELALESMQTQTIETDENSRSLQDATEIERHLTGLENRQLEAAKGGGAPPVLAAEADPLMSDEDAVRGRYFIENILPANERPAAWREVNKRGETEYIPSEATMGRLDAAMTALVFGTDFGETGKAILRKMGADKSKGINKMMGSVARGLYPLTIAERMGRVDARYNIAAAFAEIYTEISNSGLTDPTAIMNELLAQQDVFDVQMEGGTDVGLVESVAQAFLYVRDGGKWRSRGTASAGRRARDYARRVVASPNTFRGGDVAQRSLGEIIEVGLESGEALATPQHFISEVVKSAKGATKGERERVFDYKKAAYERVSSASGEILKAVSTKGMSVTGRAALSAAGRGVELDARAQFNEPISERVGSSIANTNSLSVTLSVLREDVNDAGKRIIDSILQVPGIDEAQIEFAPGLTNGDAGLGSGARAVTRSNAQGGPPRVSIDDDLSSRGEVEVELVLHEALHAATFTALGSSLAADTGRMGRELTKIGSNLRDYVSNNGDGVDWAAAGGAKLTEALKSPDELLAYGLTDANVQDFLRGLTYKNGRVQAVKSGKDKTMWDRFVDWVRGVLGLDARDSTVLEDVMNAGHSLVDRFAGATRSDGGSETLAAVDGAPEASTQQEKVILGWSLTRIEATLTSLYRSVNLAEYQEGSKLFDNDPYRQYVRIGSQEVLDSQARIDREKNPDASLDSMEWRQTARLLGFLSHLHDKVLTNEERGKFSQATGGGLSEFATQTHRWLLSSSNDIPASLDGFNNILSEVFRRDEKLGKAMRTAQVIVSETVDREVIKLNKARGRDRVGLTRNDVELRHLAGNPSWWNEKVNYLPSKFQQWIKARDYGDNVPTSTAFRSATADDLAPLRRMEAKAYGLADEDNSWVNTNPPATTALTNYRAFDSGINTIMVFAGIPHVLKRKGGHSFGLDKEQLDQNSKTKMRSWGDIQARLIQEANRIQRTGNEAVERFIAWNAMLRAEEIYNQRAKVQAYNVGKPKKLHREMPPPDRALTADVTRDLRSEFTAEEGKLFEEVKPYWDKMWEEVAQFAVDSGLRPQEWADKLKGKPYAPFFRVTHQGEGDSLKGRSGSEGNLKQGRVAVHEGILNLVRAGYLNMALADLARLANSPGGGEIMAVAERSSKKYADAMAQLDVDASNMEYAPEGTEDVDSVIDAEFEDKDVSNLAKSFMRGNVGLSNNGRVFIYAADGELIVMELKGPEIKTMLSVNESREDLRRAKEANIVTKSAVKARPLIQKATTYFPVFQWGYSLPKDLMASNIRFTPLEGDGLKIINPLEGAIERVWTGKQYDGETVRSIFPNDREEHVMIGLINGMMFGGRHHDLEATNAEFKASKGRGGEMSFDSDIPAGLDKAEVFKHLIHGGGKWDRAWDGFLAHSRRTENGMRMPIFEYYYSRGVPADQAAMLATRTVGDYRKRPAGPTMQFVNSWMPFAHAGVSSMLWTWDMLRSKKTYKRLLVGAASYGALGFAAELWNTSIGYMEDDRRPEEWARKIVFMRRTQAYMDFVKEHGRKPGEGVSRLQAKFELQGKHKKVLGIPSPWEIGSLGKVMWMPASWAAGHTRNEDVFPRMQALLGYGLIGISLGLYDTLLGVNTNKTIGGYNVVPESEKGVDAVGQRTKNEAMAMLRDTFGLAPRYAEYAVRNLGGMTASYMMDGIDTAARFIDGSLDEEALFGDILGTKAPTGSQMKNRAYDMQRDARTVEKTRDSMRAQGRTQDAIDFANSFDGYIKAWSNKRSLLNRLNSVVHGVTRMNDADLKQMAQGRGGDRKEMEREAMARVARDSLLGAHQTVNRAGLSEGTRAARPVGRLGAIDKALEEGNMGRLRTLAGEGVELLDTAIAVGQAKAYNEAAHEFAAKRKQTEAK